MKKLSFALSLFFSFYSTAEIILDVESDPIPIVDLTVILPQGGVGESIEESVASDFLSDIMSAGTMTKDKQEFNDRISRFGADYSFNLGSHYAYWSLSFPYIEGKDYSGLIELLAENWENPRFLDKQFALAQTKLVAAFKSSLDRDFGLLSSTFNRWINEKEFNTKSVFLDDLQKHASLEGTKNFFVNRVRNTENAWVGAVIPDKTIPLVKEILSTVFHRQGNIRIGKSRETLKAQVSAEAKVSKSKTFLIIDKPGRAQSIMGMRLLSPTQTKASDELAFFFGDYLLFSNGLDSYFATVIRSEKGLAYSVGGASTNFRGNRLLGFTSNPQAARQEEAMETVAKLIQDTLAQTKNLEVIDEVRWNRVMSGFRNMKALDNGLPNQRLGNRMGVITGGQSYQLAVSDSDDWKIERSDVVSILEKHWKDSTVVLGAVGNAKELSALAKKLFPDFEIKIIPYKESIQSTWIR